MRLLQRVSIRNFLVGIVGLLILILMVLSANNVWNSYTRRNEISRVDMANELSDDILAASGYEGIERGVTAAALASNKPVDASTIQKVKDLREKGDAAVHKALNLAEELTRVDSTNNMIPPALKKIESVYSSLNSARASIDREFGLSAKSYSPKDWISLMTSFIDANAELRFAAFSSTASKDTHQEALRMNLELKQAVWLVAEYAGRERATLGHFVASRKPVDPEVLAKLNTFRAIVDLNIKPILRLKEVNGTDPQILARVSEMEQNFLGSFGEVRRSVYAAVATGAYPLSGKDWIEKATSGINTILDVSAVVGQKVDDKIMADLAASKRDMMLNVAMLGFIVCLGALSFWVINSKIVAPMRYLNNTMSTIESTNDLTVTIDVKSEDESGQMATAFNRMMEKFHGMIRNIHVSIEQLASSSEELSSSAIQIAGGSRAQSERANQVSTASQEMSATLTEVAKNISGAATAAKEASDVAVKGGDIVSKTIDSMNGIAVTAKESSDIISVLGGRSKDIGNIINVIDDIADQTNLLALNAAIEAARAGEQGRGFAVVADEVRKLAEKTIKATKEIGEMIKAMQGETDKAINSMEQEVAAVENGVSLAKEAGKALTEIVSKVDEVTSMVHQVTTATAQQTTATEQISSDIEAVASVVTETTTSTEQIARASQEIAELATVLRGNVEVFRISATGASAGNVVPFREHHEPGKGTTERPLHEKAV
ncbi:MAG: methyl-accepting chemotaxis protein [Thermodesulfobacteriota bacterium]